MKKENSLIKDYKKELKRLENENNTLNEELISFFKNKIEFETKKLDRKKEVKKLLLN